MAFSTISLPRNRGRKETITVPAGGNEEWILSSGQLEERYWRISNPSEDDAVYIIATKAGDSTDADATDTPIDKAAGSQPGFLSINRRSDEVRFSFFNPGAAAIDVVAFPFNPGDK